MEVVLDSSFIISCIKHKIDFIDELEGMGFRILLPKEVYEEIKDLRLSSAPDTKKAVEVALELFEKRDIERIGLGKKKVDSGLIDIGRKGAYIATIDNEIKRSVPNKVIISDEKKIVVERA